jgi:hypothetical protein
MVVNRRRADHRRKDQSCRWWFSSVLCGLRGDSRLKMGKDAGEYPFGHKYPEGTSHRSPLRSRPIAVFGGLK